MTGYSKSLGGAVAQINRSAVTVIKSQPNDQISHTKKKKKKKWATRTVYADGNLRKIIQGTSVTKRKQSRS